MRFLMKMKNLQEKSVALPREPRYFKLKLTTMQVRKSVTVTQHCFKTNYRSSNPYGQWGCVHMN